MPQTHTGTHTLTYASTVAVLAVLSCWPSLSKTESERDRTENGQKEGKRKAVDAKTYFYLPSAVVVVVVVVFLPSTFHAIIIYNFTVIYTWLPPNFTCCFSLSVSTIDNFILPICCLLAKKSEDNHKN